MAHRATRFAEPDRSMPPDRTRRRSGLGVAVMHTVQDGHRHRLEGASGRPPHSRHPPGLYRAQGPLYEAESLFKQATAINEKRRQPGRGSQVDCSGALL